MRARDYGLSSCHTCSLLLRLPGSGQAVCPRCHSHVHVRKPNSIATTWALLLTAIIAYLPANLYPVMTVVSLGSSQSDTIFSGVVHLLQYGEWPLALIVFVASILVPLFKILLLLYLLVSVQWRLASGQAARTRLYRLVELVGRWSMVDVFVVALLASLVQAGSLATIEPGIGAMAFTVVVILSMFAAMTFDPRLIWDNEEQQHSAKRTI
jgi:paraquat-inducible protein A